MALKGLSSRSNLLFAAAIVTAAPFLGEDAWLGPSGKALVDERIIAPLTFDPSLRSAAAASGITPVFEVSPDGNRAALRIGLQRSDCVVELRIRAPVDSNSGQARIADLSGFRNEVSADLGVTIKIWSPRITPKKQSEFKLDETYLKTLGFTFARSEARPRPCGPVRPAGDSGPAQELLEPKVLQALEIEAPLLATARIEAGKQSFQFAEAGSFADRSTRKTFYSGRAGFGILFLGGTTPTGKLEPNQTFLQATLIYADGFQASAPLTICVPTSTPALTCRTRSIGPPSPKVKRIVEVDALRDLFGIVRVNPRFGWDWNADVWSAELPLYLLYSSKGAGRQENIPPWALGVAGGYRSDEHSFQVSAFFSATVDIPKLKKRAH